MTGDNDRTTDPGDAETCRWGHWHCNDECQRSVEPDPDCLTCHGIGFVCNDDGKADYCPQCHA